ncbi:MAG: shikimate dehydrogenase [Caldilineaceae bacterium]|nr:shikimate dehydrogenase [Caldilineaceae bacterium]
MTINHYQFSINHYVGLLGWPVSHSVSPAMHNAAFAELGLDDWRYVTLPVPPEPSARILEAVLGLRALGLRGANVTVPHKQAVIPTLDELTPAARAMGAVNTIWIEEDRLWGDNTDGPGFVADLRQHAVDPAGKTALVLGAGGSARAVVYGLADAGCRAIVILNRTVGKAEALAETMQQLFPACAISAGRMVADLARCADADLVINCTSLGMTPNVTSMPWSADIPFRAGQVVYDLVYNPAETRLLRKASEDGAQAVGGLGMLVMQGALAFARWTGRPAPGDVMRKAAEEAMAARY